MKEIMYLRTIFPFGLLPMESLHLIYVALRISTKSMDPFAASRRSQERKMQVLVRKSLNFQQLSMQWLNV